MIKYIKIDLKPLEIKRVNQKLIKKLNDTKINSKSKNFIESIF